MKKIKLLLVRLYLQILHIFNIEVWRNVDGYVDLYKVSNTGKVLSLHTSKILKPFSKKGYQYVNLYKTGDGKKKDFAVHRLVATAFLPNPKNLPDINHRSEVRDENDVTNLEWCSAQYNNTYGSRVERCMKTRMKNFYGTTDEEAVKVLRKNREKELQKASYERNREQRLAYSKEYRQEHKEEVLARKREWQREHKNEWNSYMKAYYAANREKILKQRNKKG